MSARSFHISVQGASHIKRGKECQDVSASCDTEDYSIAIICDGHGGDDYVRSAVGAGLACIAAENSIRDFMSKVDKEAFQKSAKQREELLGRLEGSIINAWNKAVREHYSANPFTDSEIEVLSDRAKRKYLQDQEIESAYGTTLLAAVLTPDFWFGIHIGDGKCVAVDSAGTFSQPIPWDEKCFLNATTSICDKDAIGNFRHFYSDDLPAAVFVGSDGIDDCFCNDEQLNSLYRTALYSFSTSEFNAAVAELQDYLPRLSTKGSGDDISVAAILDLNRIQEIKIIREPTYSSEVIEDEKEVSSGETDGGKELVEYVADEQKEVPVDGQ